MYTCMAECPTLGKRVKEAKFTYVEKVLLYFFYLSNIYELEKAFGTCDTGSLHRSENCMYLGEVSPSHHRL